MLAWTLADPDPARADEIARAVGVRPLVAQLLVNRGCRDVEAARRFLAPRLADLPLPTSEAGAMAGFMPAVARLARALVEREPVGIFGDYDVDGVTSAALLASFLGAAGGRVVARCASRDAGYGFGAESADAFVAEGCRVVVTCDCGTSDHDAIARARAAGVDVIVVDHHQVPDGESPAYALINPHQKHCAFPYKGLASVGVAFYLAAALRTRLRAAGIDAPDPRALLDLVALGTVADLAPLVGANRILVAAGLRELAAWRRPGLRALATAAGLDLAASPTSGDVGYKLGPRLNAPGRLGAAQLALDLLLAGGTDAAAAHAAACDDANRRRQAIQEKVLAEAIAQAEASPRGRSLVVAGDGWHHGVLGVVAARLVERYALPTVVIGLDGDTGRGSARSAGGFHLDDGLRLCASFLERFGGHAAAAGLTLRREHLARLRRTLDEAVVEHEAAGAARPGLSIDAEVPLDVVDDALVEELGRLAPFGMGNPEPLLLARAVAVERPRVVGSGHLQATLADGAAAHDAIGFGLGHRASPAILDGAGRADVAFVPEHDTFRGVRRLRLRLRAVVPHAGAL